MRLHRPSPACQAIKPLHVTGGDGGRLPENRWRTEVTELVGVGQMRDIEFVAIPGDWALHCHKSHHTMNAMGHGIANPLGVDQRGVEQDIRALLPGYMAMGENGMGEHQDHTDSGHMQGPDNTLLKVRDELAPGDFRDPGPYRNPPGTVARRISGDPDFGSPVRRRGVA